MIDKMLGYTHEVFSVVLRKARKPAPGGSNVWCGICEETVPVERDQGSNLVCTQCGMPVGRKRRRPVV